jgi:DNA-3-methyladenine glycosylase I
MTNKTITRCPWAGDNELYIKYHDEEWGVPVHDDRHLFEFLSLEGAQAGLSWITILKRRKGYKAAFDNFDIEKVSKYNEADISRLIGDARTIRNRLKINSVINNAKATLKVQKEFGSLDNYFWHFVDHKTIKHGFIKSSDVPATDDIALIISKDLKKRGFSFVGPTIIYAHMQATGMVNDHIKTCFRFND